MKIALFSLFIASASLFAASHHPQEFLQQIQGKKNEGQLIVQHFCSTCHATKPLINLGAPRIHHPKDWQTRLKQEFSVLFEHTATGYGAMPARGGCFECSDEQLTLAILALIPATKNAHFTIREIIKKTER